MSKHTPAPRHIRTWADWEQAVTDGQTTAAEEELVAACRAGKECTLGDGTRPTAPSDDRTVGADLLRYLIVGGCDGCPDLHEWGVDLDGAYITGALDLRMVTAVGVTGLKFSHFAEGINAMNARFELLSLSGSLLPSLNAQGAEVKGSVFLSKGFKAMGEVSLASAQIGGQLACDGGTFENEKGDALDAQGAQMAAFYWRDLRAMSGVIALSGARTGDLVDDAASWDMANRLYLDGFEYTSVHGPLDAPMRLEWLAKACAYDGSFSPQPYEQLAHVLKKMGRTGTARTIQLHKEDKTAQDWKARSLTRRAELRAICNDPLEAEQHHEAQDELNRLWFELIFIPLWHWLLKWLVGFGYAPQRALWWTFGTIVLSGLFYQYVWNFGGIVPNSDVILTSASWSEALAASPAHPAAYFLKQEVGQHYEAYFAFAHAADIFIPLIDFGQESAWTATTATKLGALGWVAAWGLKTFGWIVTAVGAAAITGIIRRE